MSACNHADGHELALVHNAKVAFTTLLVTQCVVDTVGLNHKFRQRGRHG